MKQLSGRSMRIILLVLVVVLSFAIGSSAFSNESEGMRPVADAGLPQYAAQEPVVLDGTGSYDPDNSGPLNYSWRQVSGPMVAIIRENTATPTICGSLTKDRQGNEKPKDIFIQTNEIQECEFELLVSDGELTSLPDTVKVIIVPDFGSSTLQLENASFDPNKPTVIYFGGGDCVTGGGTWGSAVAAWAEKANIISFSNYEPDPSVANLQTYYRYGDMIIVYLSSVAPDYKQPIQTMGWSTGGMPAIDVGIHMNRVYRDARYAVNHVTHLDVNPACRDTYLSMVVYLDSVELFLTSSVDGEQCWLDHYYGTAAYAYEPMSRVNFLWVRTGLPHSNVPNWYRNSLAGSDMNNFNSGVVGGAYWSVIGPGKNLQLTPEAGVYYFLWNGSQQSGSMSLFSQSEYPGRLPEPVTLIGPTDGAVVDANGVVLSCQVSENAIGYQLLFGSEPYRVMDYTIVSDTPEPPTEVITTFPFEQTFWTVRVYDEYGSTIYADPICIYPEVVEDSSETFVAHWKLDETDGEIAYDSAGDNDAIVHGGAWVAGKIDGALDLNGLNDYIDCGDSEQLSPEQMTISMWLKPEHMGGMRYIATRSEPGSHIIDYSITRQYTGEVDFIVGQIDSEPVSVTSSGTTPLNEWSHLAVTMDGSVASIYINDQPDNSTAYSRRIGRAGYRLIISSLGANTRFYNGIVDDVRIYNYAVKP